jgi:hypothetical protein
MKPILKYQTHLKILSCPNTLVEKLLTPVMEIDSSGNENILFHILIPIPLLSFGRKYHGEVLVIWSRAQGSLG